MSDTMTINGGDIEPFYAKDDDTVTLEGCYAMFGELSVPLENGEYTFKEFKQMCGWSDADIEAAMSEDGGLKI